MSVKTEQLKKYLPTMQAEIALHVSGEEGEPVVFMSHSILSSSGMWDEQTELLVANGYRVVRMDTRGHGGSDATKPPYSMQDLVVDTIEAMNALNIEKAHYVGLSLGGMTGFGLALDYPNRFHQFIICDARADAPPAFSAPWDERIDIAKESGCGALAQSTIERWFGKAFVEANPEAANKLLAIASDTSVNGFVGCARAIQGLNYLPNLNQISAPTTLLVGINDGPLPQAMADIQKLIPNSKLEVIEGSGHLPNIDNSTRFNDLLISALKSI
ncbi:alpha/beta hydrolase [Polynucleobacter sp. AP-Nickl1-40-C4]|jgi:3-oxoadipate enol-lactonase|uniref:alpha/beta fold hydrolase n=1 Tax=Polynucleobacter sp. AP-Nickl1-40-C4 TaxID=3108275 RepID=UPI002B226867|nr:alpha/beta hydrolase [Polynucleobacter sp. AP-Nickl1-40-C4]MEA9568965.1 alpha/beta hydrolase [Polynucleobacter sp. AP-Nickl1-40-C4]